METPKRIPKSIADWKSDAEDRTDYSKLSSLQWKPASKMEFGHFLFLRTYWNTSSAKNFRLDTFVGSDSVEEAKRAVVGDVSFSAYLDTLKSRLTGSKTARVFLPSRDVFALVLSDQDQVLHRDASLGENLKVCTSPRYQTRSRTMARNAAQGSPTPQATNQLPDTMMRPNLEQSGTPPRPAIIDGSLIRTPPNQMIKQSVSSSPSSGVPQSTTTLLSAVSPFSPGEVRGSSDEQIVSLALINFLQAITMEEEDDSSVAWTLHRNSLKMGKVYEAHTDGCLWTKNEETILAILENKAHVRQANETQIMIQESAQMAAWIYQTDLGDIPKIDAQSAIRRRLLISQDCREIYITIGEYDIKYKEYLVRTFKDKDKNSGPRFDAKLDGAFLKMRCYGPFDIKRSDHMKALAVAVVAFTKSLEGSQVLLR